jgi:hypothetical protein
LKRPSAHAEPVLTTISSREPLHSARGVSRAELCHEVATRPVAGCITFTVRAGAASTTAGNNSVWETSFIVGSSTVSRDRSGEVAGATIGLPTGETRLHSRTARFVQRQHVTVP